MNPIAEHFIKVMAISLLAYLAGFNAFSQFSEERQKNVGEQSVVELLLAFGFATLVVYVLLKVLKLGGIMKLLELLSIFSLSYLLVFMLSFSELVALITSVVVVLARHISKHGRDIGAFFIGAGGGAFFGTFFPLEVIVGFVALIIVYDFIAVFITRHMVDMAIAAEKEGIAMSVSSKGKFITPEGESAVGGISLGLGDIVFPSAMAIASLSISIPFSMLMLLAIALGYLATLAILARLKRPIPALLPMVSVQLLLLGATMFI